MSLPEISFILPSCRPYETHAKLMVESIYANCTKNFEIMYISKENPNDGRLNWIEEHPNNEGSVQPINEGVKWSRGDIICLVNDDFVLESNIDKDIDELGLFEAVSLRPATWTNDNFGRIPGQDVPNIPMMPFPLLSTDLINIVLNFQLLNPHFHHHYSDCWLSFFLYKRLGRIRLTKAGTKQTSDEHRIHRYDGEDYNHYCKLITEYEKRSIYDRC